MQNMQNVSDVGMQELPLIWSCCLQSTSAGGRRQRWTVLMETGAVAFGLPLAVQDPSSQIP